MVGLLIEIGAVGIYKILGASDVGMLEGWNLVDIHESTIENGDGDSLAAIADIVEALTVQHLNLLVAMTIDVALKTVPRVEMGVGLGLQYAFDTVGCYPYLLAALDVCLLANGLQQGGISRAHQNGVVPAAGAYHP